MDLETVVYMLEMTLSVTPDILLEHIYVLDQERDIFSMKFTLSNEYVDDPEVPDIIQAIIDYGKLIVANDLHNQCKIHIKKETADILINVDYSTVTINKTGNVLHVLVNEHHSCQNTSYKFSIA